MKKFRLYFDTDKEVVWLNQMAQDGYALERYVFGVYTFKKCEPGEFVYQIDYTDGMFQVNNDYRNFMSEMGVDIVALWGPWVYLRKYASEGPFELYSDVESRIAYYQKILTTFKIVSIIEIAGVWLEVFAALNGLALGWVFAFMLAALATAFVRQCFNINIIISDLKNRGRTPENSWPFATNKRRPSVFLSLGFLFNGIGFLPMVQENEILRGFLCGAAIVFFIAGIIFTAKNFQNK